MNRPSPLAVCHVSGRDRRPSVAVPALLLLLLLLVVPPSAPLRIHIADLYKPGVGVPVGYKVLPAEGTSCYDYDDNGYEIKAGSCKGKTCSCVYNRIDVGACDENGMNDQNEILPYAVTCADTCKLTSPSTDKKGAMCTNNNNRTFTYEVSCINGIFVQTERCFAPQGLFDSLSGTPVIDSGRKKGENFVAPTMPSRGSTILTELLGTEELAGLPIVQGPEGPDDTGYYVQGVGYDKFPNKGTECFDIPEFIFKTKIGNRGPCADSNCGCVLTKFQQGKTDICREKNDKDKTYAEICPGICEGLNTYKIKGGPCHNRGCKCVKSLNDQEKDDKLTRNIETDSPVCREMGNEIPYAVTCPVTCELRTLSSTSCTSTEHPNEIATFEVVCTADSNRAATFKEITQHYSKTGEFPEFTPSYYDEIDQDSCYAHEVCGQSEDLYKRTVREYITSPVSDLDALNDPLSPQYGAEMLLINNGLSNYGFCPSPYQNPFFTQRYIWWLLYFEFGIFKPGELYIEKIRNPCMMDPAVICVNNVIIGIGLGSQSLTGTIPKEIGFLAASNVEIIDLSNNFLTGPLPSSIGNLTTLTSLNLSRNDLTGTIPLEISRLRHLEFLALDTNRLEGTLPPGLASLTHLIVLSLFHNQLYGTVPELGYLGKLVELHLDQNRLKGACSPLLCANRKNNWGVGGAQLEYLTVDCNIVDCPCATHCNYYSNNFGTQEGGNSAYQSPCCGGGYTSCCWGSP